MWQFELVQSVGSGKSAHGSNSRTWHFRATFSFAEGVTTTLSLPWSLYEHMAGNSLTAAQIPMDGSLETDLIQLATLIDRMTEQPESWDQVSLPSITVRQLRAALDLGRAALNHPGVREFEGEGGLPIPLNGP